MKKIWIFAGEESGDTYGAQLAIELRKIRGDEITVAGMGGKKMREAGVEIMVDSTELGVVGLIEILGQIFTFIRIFLSLKRRALKEQPDAVILIDYPGFNIRFAKSMYKNGIPVIWYVSPQVWLWRKSNIPKLATYCEKMLVIFPFETETYAGTGLDAEFVGHPLMEIIGEQLDPRIIRDAQRVLLLPGSRTNEVTRLLVPMLEAAAITHQRHPDLKFTISCPRQKIADICQGILDCFGLTNPSVKLPEIEVVCGETIRWQQEAIAGMSASGTVTVECAISGLPLVVMYKLHPITWLLAKLIIRKLFRNSFTMPNIIANKEIFKEFLQDEVQPPALAEALEEILPNGSRRDAVDADLKAVVNSLLVKGEAPSHRAALAVLKFLDESEYQKAETEFDGGLFPPTVKSE